MTLYQYNDLSEQQRYEALWKDGAMVDQKIEDGYKVILYQLFSFYVELYYHQEQTGSLKATFQLDLIIITRLNRMSTKVSTSIICL
jgi:hypothetical protein